jgi:hypothetical protein
MRSFRGKIMAIITPILAGLAMLVGCAQQDLYEPPGAPFTRVGRVSLPSENEGVAVMGRYAFVAGGQAGLHAIDFSNPSQPVLLQTINTLKYSESVEVVRSFFDYTLQDIALVVEGTEGITSYDITDPGAMIDQKTSTTAVFGNRVAIDVPVDPEEPYVVFLAESWKGVRVFAANPGEAGLEYDGVFSGTNGYAEGIDIKDGYAYVADDEMGLAVLDARVLELGSFALVSWCDSPGDALDIEISGDYAFVADGSEGLAVFAIDGGETPVRVAQLALEGTSRAIAVRDGLAILCAQGAGVHFVDVRNPRRPVFLGRVLTEYAMDLAISHEGFILIADREEGLIILEGSYPFADTTPPLAVTNLEARPFGTGTILLEWVMTGDDRLEGLAAEYEIRIADSPIVDDETWENAEVLENLPAIDPPGTFSSFILTDLVPDQVYHFAMIVKDEAGNSSGLSNRVSVAAGSGILLLDPTLNIPAGTPSEEYSYEVTYYFTDDPVLHQVIIDGTPHDMLLVEENDLGFILYRYQTSMAAGDHSFQFHFKVSDPEIPEALTEMRPGPIVGSLVFTMGSDDTVDDQDPLFELGRDSDEWKHYVVFSENLADNLVAGTFEVTQAEWNDMGLQNPSDFPGNNLPVDSVSWLQAVQFCNLLSADQGLNPAYVINGNEVTWTAGADGWRLPTEAEWEWLARAGSTTAFAGGTITELVCNPDAVLLSAGWYCGSDYSDGYPGTRPVGQLDPTIWGHHDTHGNVWEWCWDWYGDYDLLDTDGDGVVRDPVGPTTGTERVLRGGSWYSGSADCRSANRSARFPDSADNVVGLRVVRTISSSR